MPVEMAAMLFLQVLVFPWFVVIRTHRVSAMFVNMDVFRQFFNAYPATLLMAIVIYAPM
jgi:hypothetical protein